MTTSFGKSLVNCSKQVPLTPTLRTLLTPQLPDCVPHTPTVKQAAFLLLNHLEALYGGAAGGGKSDALLMAALQGITVPGYAALLLRRTYADLALPGALMERAHHWLRGHAQWSDRDKTWQFANGASLSFGYLDHARHKYRYQSSEFQFIGFDELTQFREDDYLYLFSRLRRTRRVRVPLRMRAASNPGGLGHDWVRRRFLLEGKPASRCFLPATLNDNPHLDSQAYRESLAVLDPVTRQRLLLGNWDIDDADRLLSYDDIARCTGDCLWPASLSGLRLPPSRSSHRHALFVGIDIGRTRDRTVIWTWELIGDVAWCRDVTVLHKVPFAEQREAITRRLNDHVIACAIDRGGIGAQLAEELEQNFPGVVQGVTLSATVQARLAQRFATAIQQGRVRLPDDANLRDDFRLVHAPRRIGGLDRVETERGESGHADRFWAAALGYDAALAHTNTAAASLPRAFKPRH